MIYTTYKRKILEYQKISSTAIELWVKFKLELQKSFFVLVCFSLPLSYICLVWLLEGLKNFVKANNLIPYGNAAKCLKIKHHNERHSYGQYSFLQC